MKSILLLIFCTLLLSPIILFSQDEAKKDTVFIDQDFEISIDDSTEQNDEFFDFKEFRFRFRKESHPYLKIRGGLNQYAHRNAIQSFRQVGNIELQLGYTRSFKKYRSYLASFNDRYVAFSLNNKNLNKSSIKKPNELAAYQLSIGEFESYGYRVKDALFSLGTGGEINWTQTTFDRSSIGPDTLILDYYNNAIRFGQAYNSELSLQLFDFISFQANYKYGLIFPRHLFWKHLGSFMIEEAVKSLLEDYLKRVFSMRPAVGPIVHFILKSSLDYLLYELKKEKMNWPFKTVSPLTYDIYTIGLKFTF